MRGSPHQVTERSQRVLADHFAVVDCFEIKAIAFIGGYVEVVGPELDHHLVQLARAVDLSQQRGALQFSGDAFTVVAFEELIADAFQLVRIHLKSLESLQAYGRGKVVDRLRRELFFDPTLQTDLSQAGSFDGARTEGQPRERQEI